MDSTTAPSSYKLALPPKHYIYAMKDLRKLLRGESPNAFIEKGTVDGDNLGGIRYSDHGATKARPRSAQTRLLVKGTQTTEETPLPFLAACYTNSCSL